MIIDCHGHYTTEPQQLHDFRKKQTEAAHHHQHLLPGDLKITDDQPVGWVERSKTHQDIALFVTGFARAQPILRPSVEAQRSSDGERSLRVCQARKPDGRLDLHSRAPREKRRATIVQGLALCAWPPSFRMETKFERPDRLCADMG
jgi:hypothetical protein